MNESNTIREAIEIHAAERAAGTVQIIEAHEPAIRRIVDPYAN